MQGIRVGNAASKGQGLFACRDIPTRATLYTTNELTIAAINTTELSNFCYSCYAGSQPSTEQWYNFGQYRDAELKVCSGCQVARFCGERCQKQAWKKNHKHECKIFKKLRPKVLPEQVRAILTFLLQHDNGLLADGVWSDITNAMSHMDDLRAAGGDTWMSLMLMAKATHEYSQTKVDLNTLLKLFCILKVNGMQLSTTYGDPIGAFLDTTLLKINHSCDGNVMVYRPTYTNGTGWIHRRSDDKATIRLLPLRPIAKGEELTTSYIEFTKHVSDRQKNLQNDYFFTCTCGKCTKDADVAKKLSSTDPTLAKQQATWREEVNTHLELLKNPPYTISSSITALTSVVRVMESSLSFNPADDPYPRAVHELKLLHMDNHKSVDQALICGLKEHLLIGPAIYSSPYYSTRVTNAVYLLQVFALLDDSFNPLPRQDPRLVAQAKSIERKGLSKKSFKYWRLRICIHTRAYIDMAALTDLVEVLRREQVSIGLDRAAFHELVDSEAIKTQGEKEMRSLLDISEERWEMLVRPELKRVEDERDRV